MKMENQIQIGDKIRSHDFEPRPDRGECFVEGFVTGCEPGGMIEIYVTRDVWCGEEVPPHKARVEVRTASQLLLGDWEGRLVKLEIES
jgi:hypothetical protein